MADQNTLLPIRQIYDRNASPSDNELTFTPTGVQGSVLNTVYAQDFALHDESGNAYTETNPLPVFAVADAENGTETHDFDTASAIAKDASANHDYSVADGDTFTLKQVLASSSGACKFQLQVGDGGVSEVFTTIAVQNGTASDPNVNFSLNSPVIVVGTVNTTTIRVIKTNRENQAQDLYSTIIGVNRT